jgi:hypothetical protein
MTTLGASVAPAFLVRRGNRVLTAWLKREPTRPFAADGSRSIKPSRCWGGGAMEDELEGFDHEFASIFRPSDRRVILTVIVLVTFRDITDIRA